MERVLSVDELYDVCIECLGCCGDYDVLILEEKDTTQENVYMIDLCEKITEHKDGSVSFKRAFLMTQDDYSYDEDRDYWWSCDSGTEYKLKIDENGKIISKRKVRG